MDLAEDFPEMRNQPASIGYDLAIWLTTIDLPTGAAGNTSHGLDEPTHDQTEAVKVESAEDAIACPVCGAATVQEKCKIICKSDLCRGRVIYNCAEF